MVSAFFPLVYGVWFAPVNKASAGDTTALTPLQIRRFADFRPEPQPVVHIPVLPVTYEALDEQQQILQGPDYGQATQGPDYGQVRVPRPTLPVGDKPTVSVKAQA